MVNYYIVAAIKAVIMALHFGGSDFNLAQRLLGDMVAMPHSTPHIPFGLDVGRLPQEVQAGAWRWDQASK